MVPTAGLPFLTSTLIGSAEFGPPVNADLLGPMSESESAVRKLNEILDILQTDLYAIPPLEDGSGTEEEVQRRRRAFIRDLFVYFEAVVFQLKQLALQQATDHVSFTSAELAFLHERAYRLTDKGDAKEFPARPSLPANLRFAAQMFAKAHRTTFEGDYSDAGWNALIDAQRVRHRLTHPKDPSGLSVSYEEVELARDAYRRFLQLYDEIDVLICPACSVSPFPHEQLYVTEISGLAMDTYMRWLAITYGITMTTHPVLVLPCGRDHRDLPFGIQIVGRCQDDAALLRIAAALERHMADHPEMSRPLPDLESLRS